MDGSLDHAEALAAEGLAAFKAGDAERSRRLNEESLELARRLDDAPAIVRALAGLMRLGLRDRDFDAVEALARECEQVASDAGDRALERLPLHMRAEAARMRGELARARTLYDRSIALNRELGNDAMVRAELGNKGWLELADGRPEEAERLLRESLALAPEDDAYGRAFCLLGLARLDLERGDAAGVDTLVEAERLLARAELVWDPAEEDEHARTLALARAVAGDRLDAARAAS